MRAFADYREGPHRRLPDRASPAAPRRPLDRVLDRGKIVERRADSARRVVSTRTDITPIRQARQALLDKQAAELASRARGQFTSRMSHGMRTPLNAVIGFSQLLRNASAGDPPRSPVRRPHPARQRNICSASSTGARPAARRGKPRRWNRAPSSWRPSSRPRSNCCARPRRHRGVALSSQVPPGRAVLADERCLRQVLMNMVSNAVKYNRPAAGWW